ncbi:MAG: AsmA family protein [Woeseiaceae bacterium]
MRWARRILIALSVVIVMLGAVVVLLLTIDLGRFKGDLEDYVSDATGRDFVIEGPFEPSVGETIDIMAEGVRLANADWGTSANILELQRVFVSVDTWSLFSGPIDILNLEVEGLTLHVEENPDTQQSSWSFGDTAVAANEDSEPFELPLWMERAHLQQISVTYGQGWLDEPRNIRIHDATFTSDESDMLTMNLAGAIDDDLIAADGRVGPMSALLDGKNHRWQVQAKVGQFLASTEGSFRDLFKLEGPNIHAVMQGPSAERALARFGLPALARGPVDIELAIADDSGGVEVHVEGEFGDLTTDIVGQAQSLTAIDDLELSVDLRGPNLKALGELFDAGFLPPTEFIVDGEISTSGGSLRTQSLVFTAGDTRLEIEGKLAPETIDPDARLNLLASGPALNDFLPPSLAERVPSGAFEIRAIATGELRQPELQRLTVKLADHEVIIDGKIPLDGDVEGFDTAVSAKGPDFDQIVGPWIGEDIAAEPYQLDAKVSNAGQGFILKDLTLALTSAQIAMTGSSGTLPGFNGLDASIKLNGDDLEDILEPWTDLAVPALPFDLNGTLRKSNGALQLTNVVYHLGGLRGSLDGTTGTLPSLDGLRINTSLTGTDFSELKALVADQDAEDLYFPAADFETHSALSKTSAGWFLDSWRIRVGETHLEMNGALGDFENADGIDVDFTASGPDLRLYVPDSNLDVAVPYEFKGGMKIGDTAIELQEVDLRVGETTAWLDGRLPTSDQLMNAEFDVRVAGPNLERFAQAINIQGLPADAFRFEGAMKRSGQAYRIENLTAVVGDNDLGGELGLEIGDKLRITGQLESGKLNLTELFGDEEEDKDEETVVDAPPPDRLIPDTPLPLDLLDVADLDVTLRLHQFDSGYFEVGTVELTAVAANDELHIDTSRASLSHGGTLTSSLDLTRTADNRADVKLSAVATQFEFQPPVDREGTAIDRPPKDLELELFGSGGTIRELAAGANGSVDLRVGKGELDNQLRGLLTGDFLKQLLSAINPLSKTSKRTNLSCGFLEIDVVNGMATTRALGFQTDQLAVASIGTVNLATEALDLSFRVKQREGIGVSLAGVINPYIKVGGTLAKPALTIDTKRGLLSGTFAVLTGGLSILAKGAWDRYLSQDNYCEVVLEAIDAGEIPVWEGAGDAQ